MIGVWPSGSSFVDARDWVAAGIARMVDVAGGDLLLRQGFSPEGGGKLLGGNYVRVFRAAAAARRA